MRISVRKTGSPLKPVARPQPIVPFARRAIIVEAARREAALELDVAPLMESDQPRREGDPLGRLRPEQASPDHGSAGPLPATWERVLDKLVLSYTVIMLKYEIKSMTHKTDNTTNLERAGDMSLVRVKRAAQITLPAEARKALRVKEGDYLEAEVVENGVLLRPVTVIDRSRAWDELMAIVNKPKWRGPGPEPSDEELMEMVVEEIHDLRRNEHDKGGAR